MKKIMKKQQDRQKAPPAGQCSRCGGELYPGSLCWRLSGYTLCEGCVVLWIQEELVAYRMPVEEVRQ